MSHPFQGQPPQQFYPQQPQPLYPPQTNPQPQYQQPQFQQPQPSVQQQQPPAPQPQLLDAIIPMGSPDWPQELHGKPVREALRLYGIMRQDFINRNRPQPPQNPQFQQTQPQPQPQPQFQQPQQPQRPQQPGPQAFDPANIQQMIADGVRQAIGSSPMAAVTMETVMGQVRMRYPDWNQYHMQILQEIQGADSNALMDPKFWESAYFLVKGRAMSQGQTPVYQPQYGNGYDPNGGYGQPPAGHRDPTGAIRTPPPVFTEQPQAPGAPPSGAAALTHDPRIVNMARRFGMSPEQYAASYAQQMGL